MWSSQSCNILNNRLGGAGTEKCEECGYEHGDDSEEPVSLPTFAMPCLFNSIQLKGLPSKPWGKNRLQANCLAIKLHDWIKEPIVFSSTARELSECEVMTPHH